MVQQKTIFVKHKIKLQMETEKKKVVDIDLDLENGFSPISEGKIENKMNLYSFFGSTEMYC